MRTLVSAIISGLLLFGSMPDAAAQTFQGTLRGAVRDAQGVVPGVEVVLLNEGTNIERSTFSNEVGEFVFAAVTPGDYTLRAALAGFKTFERRNIRIATQQLLTLDVILEVGAIEEAITVTAEVPLIETSTASHGDVLDRRALEILPAPGRNAFMMSVSVPTVVASGDAQFNRQQDQTNASLVSLGGGARRANNYLLDGFPITDMRNRAVVNPTIEALDEVKVQVHTYDAEMGRTGGGTFNVTAKSGTNEFRGSGFYQTRPDWGIANNWFDDRLGRPKPEGLYYRLYGGGIGGPIVRNRTFFWTATEGYRSNTTRNGNLRFPTARERQGDFSQSFDAAGNLMVIYDPLTKQPFPGNVIPAGRINAVGQNIVNLMPLPDDDVSRLGQTNYFRTANIVDAADMVTHKMEHKFSDKVSLSGIYLYNKTDEPFNIYWDTNTFQDPNATPLRRRIHAITVNNTIIPNNTTVVSLRFGWNQFRDDCVPNVEFDPATLGFNPAFVNSMQFRKHPDLTIQDYGEAGLFGSGSANDIKWYSWGVNGAVSRFFGRHTVKMGADYRVMGVDTTPFGASSGNFTFNRGYTALNNVGGSSIASLLLGYPVSGFVDVASQTDAFLRYYGAYIQDDFRVNSRFTVNYGLRYEYETGLMERDDRFTVGFDRDAVNPLAAITGMNLRGGLIYAGQDGNNRHQGDPPAAKLSPRVGAVYSLDDRTVLRGGYGIFWAPWNYQFPGTTNYGQFGYTRQTTMQQDVVTPILSLDNPFPGGVQQPVGNSLGLLTGVGGDIETIDQFRKAPRIQQWSVDVQRELGGQMAVSIGYMGAKGDDLGLGGSLDGLVNINQIQNTQGLTPAQLLERVPNPFFGVAQAGGISTLATIERGQLLRPYPHFRNVTLRQMTEGRSLYHAVVLKLDKRISQGWGGRFHYTWSRLKDNQYGETNHYSQNQGNRRPQDNYDLDAEYALGVLDTPHRVVLAPIVELPFGVGRAMMNQGGVMDYILGGWSLSAVATFESGFPIAPLYTNAFADARNGLFGAGLRPVQTGVDPKGNTNINDVGPGSPVLQWVNPAAYAPPPVGQFSAASRTDDRFRTQFRKNLDFVANKSFRTGGRTRTEVKVEMLNLTSSVKFRDMNMTPDAGTFGQVTRQSGFMRIFQFSFRFTF